MGFSGDKVATVNRTVTIKKWQCEVETQDLFSAAIAQNVGYLGRECSCDTFGSCAGKKCCQQFGVAGISPATPKFVIVRE
jgi:hypothetical protein